VSEGCGQHIGLTVTEPGDTTLVIGTKSGAWRRRLGPLAWAALVHLALIANPDHHGWAAALGVRDIATGIGVSKDTAARAVTVLRVAGLVTVEQLDRPDGRRRSGYRLHLWGSPGRPDTDFYAAV
jgi:DNA-binding transcriptional ArsR family regulator